MRKLISKRRLKRRLENLLALCQQMEQELWEAGCWTPQCTESFQAYSVQNALNMLETRTVKQFQAWLGEPSYTIDHAIRDCLDP